MTASDGTSFFEPRVYGPPAGRGSQAMPTQRLGVGFTPMETRRDVMVDTARLADELGFELIAVPGAGARLHRGADRDRTGDHEDRLVSGILSVWGRTRHPDDDRRDPSPDLRRPLPARSGRQHASAGRGLPRHPVQAAGRQAGRHGDGRPRATRRRARSPPPHPGGPSGAARPAARPDVPIWVAASALALCSWRASSQTAGSPPSWPTTAWPSTSTG